jgi:hypothetical protein
MAIPAKAEAAARRLVFFRNSRREAGLFDVALISVMLLTKADVCQFISVPRK